MSIGVKINIPAMAIAAQKRKQFDQVAKPALVQQVIKDSNYYCRKDQGGLISSSLTASQPENGLAIWDTPYAKKVYYTGRPSRDKNPNASLMWFEKAKAAHKKDWEKIIDKSMKG